MKVKKNISIRVMFLVLLMVLVFGIMTSAKTVINYSWKEDLDPFSFGTSAAAHVFKNFVENHFDGEVEVKLHPAAVLGDAESQFRQCVSGAIEVVGGSNAGILATLYYPPLNLVNIPYLFDDWRGGWDTWEPGSRLHEAMNDDMAEKVGIRPLAIQCTGMRHFTNDVREIRSPEDMEGLKIRTMSITAHQRMVEALGASAQSVAWNELYGALDTGVVDGQENPTANIIYASLDEVQDYLTMDGHIANISLTVINEDFYQSLSPRNQKVIDDAAELSGEARKGVDTTKAAIAMAEIRKQMQVTWLTPEEINEFRKAAQPEVIEFVKEEIGEDADKWINLILEEAEKANEKYRY